MPEPNIGDREYTGFPFGFTHIEWEEELRYLTVAELEDSLEIKRWLVIDPEETSDGSRYFFAAQIHALTQELERRKTLLKQHGTDPLAPPWKGGTMANNRERIDRIKERWPIDLFLQQSLGCKLIRRSNGSFITNCPFPNHDDTTPSFTVNTARGVGYCFGCHRGGDVIEVARWVLNTKSFPETLAALENEGAFHDRSN